MNRAAAEAVWGPGLGDRRLALREGGDIHVVEGLFSVKVLLGDEVFGEESLGALIVELLLLKVSLCLFYVGFSGLLRGDIGIDVGAGGSDGRCWAATALAGCSLSTVASSWPLVTWSPLFDVQVRNAPEGGGRPR